MQELEQSPEQSQFLASMKNYIVGEPKIVSGEKVWNLKPAICADGPVAVNELKANASKVGITFSTLPTPKFSLKKFSPQTDTTLLYLHESQIEDGGPQPREEINPSDPDTQALFELIKADGQGVPIEVFPSPNTPGKYRIAEGHRRRMIIFNMLRLDGIWAVSKQRSKLKADEDAFDFNHARKNLSAIDQAKWFVHLMREYPTVYPNQQSIAERRKLSKQYVSEVLNGLKLIEAQKPNLSPEVSAQTDKLNSHTLRFVNTAPEESKPAVLTGVVQNELTSPQTKELVEVVKAEPNPTPEFVAEEAKKIADAKAERSVKEADKAVAKNERARDKVVVAGEDYPEDLMKAVYGHLGIKGIKVTPEKANLFAKDVVDILVARAIEKEELDSAFAEADLWK